MIAQVLIGTLFSCPAVADDAKPTSPLPAKWHGTWSGKMLSTGRTGKATEVPVVLKIEPIKGTRDVTWVVTYGTGAKALVKNYKLVPHGDKPGRFRIDEGNGVALDARLVNGVLYSQTDVGSILLTGRYQLRGDSLRFEVTSAKPAGFKPGQSKVRSYDVEVVQSAALKKK